MRRWFPGVARNWLARLAGAAKRSWRVRRPQRRKAFQGTAGAGRAVGGKPQRLRQCVQAISPMASTDSASRRRRAARALVSAMRRRWRDETEGSTLLAPISPSPASVVGDTLARVPGLGPESLLADLGCGDGRWLVEAARTHRCRAVGWDVNEEVLARGRAALAAEPEPVRARVSLLHQDFLLNPPPELAEATHVVIYWFSASCAQQADWLLSRLGRVDCTIVSVAFRPPHWTHFATVPCGKRTVWLFRAGDQPTSMPGRGHPG